MGVPKLDAQDTVGDRDQRHTSRVNKAFEAVVNNTRQRRDRRGTRQRCSSRTVRRSGYAADRTRHPWFDNNAPGTQAQTREPCCEGGTGGAEEGFCDWPARSGLARRL